MCILLRELVKAYGPEMFERTNFFLFLFVLHCPPSLLIPLKPQATTSNTNNLAVLKTKQLEKTTPNNSIATELIQLIDVKDIGNQAISNINDVVVTDESIQNKNNGSQNNRTNDLVAQNLLVSIKNTSASLTNAGVTNPLNDSSSLLLIKSQNNTSGNILKAENITIHGLQNNLANKTQPNPLNTTNNAKVKNGTTKEVSTVKNGSTSNVNVSSTLVPYTNLASGGTTRLNNNLYSGIENVGTGVPSLETIDGENTLHESSNNAEVELAWRSDIPVGRNKTKKLKHIAKLDSQNNNLQTNNSNGSVNNSNSELLDSEKDDEKSILVILNSGKIDGLSVNSPANNGNLQKNSDNNFFENLNSSNSKLLSNLINSTINDVLSNILQQNHSQLNFTHNIFLLLNSGSISNVHISSPVLENIVKNTTLKDRLRRHLNESNKNNTHIESVTLKPSIDKSNHIIDIKFRTGEHQGTQNNVNKNKDNSVTIIPLDNNQNNSSVGSNAPDNATLANSNAPVVDLIKDEENSSSEAPAFRSLLSDKIRKLQQVSNVINNELDDTKDHNLVLKLLPVSPPISIDLNQIPLNNILGGALSFINRLKRNTHDKEENSYPCKTKTDKHHTMKSCKKSKSINNDLNIKTIPTRKNYDDNNSNVLKLDSVELVCPLSLIVKLYAHQVLDNISKSNPDSFLNKILSSFTNGNEDAINLASKELFDIPIPVKLRLQLVHGKTKEFMEQLSDIMDATLCSLS